MNSSWNIIRLPNIREQAAIIPRYRFYFTHYNRRGDDNMVDNYAIEIKDMEGKMYLL
ncbi:hypothetical protein V7759_03060 [Bacillus sp. H7(2023)]|uniref:hypothetical protein n=1 Tax=Bacillus sp. GFa4/2 TaxID=3418495 RepID=UPI003B5FFF5B